MLYVEQESYKYQLLKFFAPTRPGNRTFKQYLCRYDFQVIKLARKAAKRLKFFNTDVFVLNLEAYT